MKKDTRFLVFKGSADTARSMVMCLAEKRPAPRLANPVTRELSAETFSGNRNGKTVEKKKQAI